MAEINIERKNKPIWPWLLLVLVVALLAWGLYELTNEPDDDIDAEEMPTTGLVLPAPPQPLRILCATV